MQRVTISLDEGLARDFDELSREKGYQSRSEAVRDLVRSAVDERRADHTVVGHCVANLSYVYDHHVRALAERLTAVLADPERAAAMGRAGRERAVERFGWDAIARRTLEVYASVLR